MKAVTFHGIYLLLADIFYLKYIQNEWLSNILLCLTVNTAKNKEIQIVGLWKTNSPK